MAAWWHSLLNVHYHWWNFVSSVTDWKNDILSQRNLSSVLLIGKTIFCRSVRVADWKNDIWSQRNFVFRVPDLKNDILSQQNLSSVLLIAKTIFCHSEIICRSCGWLEKRYLVSAKFCHSCSWLEKNILSQRNFVGDGFDWLLLELVRIIFTMIFVDKSFELSYKQVEKSLLEPSKHEKKILKEFRNSTNQETKPQRKRKHPEDVKPRSVLKRKKRKTGHPKPSGDSSKVRNLNSWVLYGWDKGFFFWNGMLKLCKMK